MYALRGIARTVKGKLRASRTKILRRFGVLKNDWSGGLSAEDSFWENALSDPARYWLLEEFQQRTAADSELQRELKELIEAPPQSVVRILDVGAGPLTTLGKTWPGRRLEIVAIDPLAENYRALLHRLGISAPVQTSVGHGEKLLDLFGQNQFDLAYASNALDHSYDPLLAIKQMFAVVKPSRFVYLWHFANEGLQESYSGLHQWNFDIRKGDFLIGDGRRTCSLRAEFDGRGELTCEEKMAYGKRVVIAKIKKVAS